jgi:cell division cycle 14
MAALKAAPIIEGRLYYCSVRQGSPPQNQGAHWFSIDDALVYWNFFLDFGPLNLGQLYRFCALLNQKLRAPELSDRPIYYYSSSDPRARSNAAVLIGCWQVLYLQRTPDEAWAPLASYGRYAPFHDASPCACTYDVTVLDCLRGLHKARQCNFFNFETFDLAEYEHFEAVENGDLNWLAYGRFFAFAGPHDTKMRPGGYETLAPEDYVPYFQSRNVSLIVRLNKPYYDKQKFLKAGIQHEDMYYIDGSNPPLKILRKFLEACEATKGAIGVHCKAGLGRTGTCIGCYCMKHHKFSAAEIIAWFRICRPGSVIGPQQHFMQEMEPHMWREGEAFRLQQNVQAKPPPEKAVDSLSGSMSRLGLAGARSLGAVPANGGSPTQGDFLRQARQR